MFKPQLFGILMFVAHRAAAANSRRMETLVSASCLADKLKSGGDELRVVHASWSNCTDYEEGHIPGAVCFDGEYCRDRTSPYKNMLPKPEDFAEYVGQKLGIDNNTDVVIYDSNDTVPVIISGARLWYMFRVFGHERVRLLNGGLRKWKEENRTVTSEPTQVTPKTFVPHFRPELVLSYEQVLEKVAKNNELQLLDARPKKFYDGHPSDPYQDGKIGHIHNAKNLPFNTLINNETGLIRENDDLQDLYEDAGINLTRPFATSCGTGMSASGLALGAYLLGKEVPVYDGSWFEWARRAPDEYIEKNGN